MAGMDDANICQLACFDVNLSGCDMVLVFGFEYEEILLDFVWIVK